MAEESVPLKPDVTRPYGGNSKRNSLAGACSANGREEKTLPHYRRASIGSCHDFCKYGKKHESDQEKARHPFQERIVKKPSDNEPNLLETLNLPQQRKNTSVMKSKSFSDSRTRTPNASEVIKLQAFQATVAKLKSKHSLNSRSHSHDAIKLEVPTDSSESKTSRKHEMLSMEKKTSMANLRSSPSLKSHFSDALKLMQQDGSSSSDKVGVSSKAKGNSFSICRTTSSKLKSQAEKHPSASSVSSEGLNFRRNSGISDMKMGKSTAATSFKASLKKVLALPRASFANASSLTARKNRNLKVVPLQKNQNKVKMADQTQQPSNEHHERNNDTLQEKTLYVIKTENILLTSDHKNEKCATELSTPPAASSPKTSSLLISPPLSSPRGRDQNDEYGYTVTGAEDDCDSEYDEDEAENNDPRRLKLRRRSRVLGENQNVKADRRTFRIREDDGDMNEKKPGGEKVVLRHQDLQGKKDEKGLFNCVIEETASKLVETRNGKVKALVGAFESIISLQDTKLSAKIQYHCTFSRAD